MKYDISSVLEAASEAATEAVSVLTVYDTDLDSGSIEEALEEVIDEAIERDREERKKEVPFTIGELSQMRSGLLHLKIEARDAETAKRLTAIHYGIDMETDKWKTFETHERKTLDELYDKLSGMISQSIAERHK